MNLLDKARRLTTTLKHRGQVRRKLRGPADFRYAIADSIGMLNREAWTRAAARGGFFMSWEYLSAMEAVWPDNIAPRYALIFDPAEGGDGVNAGDRHFDRTNAAHGYQGAHYESHRADQTQGC